MENRDMEVLSDARISGEKYAFLPETLILIRITPFNNNKNNTFYFILIKNNKLNASKVRLGLFLSTIRFSTQLIPHFYY